MASATPTPGSAAPVAFYRLQLTPDFGFERAERSLDLIAGLGCSHAYLSPIFEAVPGSRHGYDVTDPTRVRAEFGGREGFERFVRACRRRGLGVLIDIVPNHMASSEHGPQWRDVLSRGEASAFARWFDLRWRPFGATGHRRLLLPILGAPLRRAVDEGQVRVVREGASLAIDAHGRRLPLRDDAGHASEELEDLLESQHYALVHWELARELVAYRRYFDIGDLVALRMDDEAVFSETHALVDELASAGLIDGVRVDHIDGLADPAEYTRRLRALLRGAYERTGRAGDALIYVEKTLGDGERLPRDWPVDGTTGYDLLSSLTGLLAHPGGLATIGSWYAHATGATPDLESAALAKKLEVSERLFRGETDELVDAAIVLAWASSGTRDIRPSDIRRAVIASAARCPVVRTYLTPGCASDDDVRAVHGACDGAAQMLGDAEALRALEFVRDALLGPARPGDDAGRDRLRWEFVTMWQRMTVPLAAKGFEDATLYNDARCLALNEIGVEARAWEGGCSLEDFHGANERRVGDHPVAMTTTSTHDTKRSEDVRARLFSLTTLAGEWIARAEEWAAANAALKDRVDGKPAPDRVDELFTYQTLLGAWPLNEDELPGFVERVRRYVVKAARESGRHSNWITPNGAYESAWERFVERLCDEAAPRSFRDGFHSLRERIALRGMENSLAQCALKVFSPGVPDIYWGNDRWDFSLVDPDNRRPVDFGAAGESFDAVGVASVETARALLASWRDGRVKQFVLREALRARRSLPGLFTGGSVVRLSRRGDPFVAFERRLGERRAVIVATRGWGAACPMVGESWGDAAIEVEGAQGVVWRDVFTGRDRSIGSRAMVRDLLDVFPVGAFVSERAR